MARNTPAKSPLNGLPLDRDDKLVGTFPDADAATRKLQSLVAQADLTWPTIELGRLRIHFPVGPYHASPEQKRTSRHNRPQRGHYITVVPWKRALSPVSTEASPGSIFDRFAKRISPCCALVALLLQ